MDLSAFPRVLAWDAERADAWNGGGEWNSFPSGNPFADHVLTLGAECYSAFVLGNARALEAGEKAFVISTYGEEVSYLTRPYPERSRKMVQTRIRDRLDAAERKQVVDWPPEMAGWLERNVSPASDRLPHDPACTGGRLDRSPEIVSPVDGSRFHLVPGASFRQRLHFSAVAAADARKLFWFVDGELRGEAGLAEDVGWDLVAGSHRIRCVDDRGRVAAASFEVSQDAP